MNQALWLALYFPQLPLEVFVRGRQQAGAMAVIESVAGRERLSRCNGAAVASGVCPGQALPAALALCAGLAVQRRDREVERRALQDLALWAYQYSPRISFEPSLLLLEVGGSRRLFGGLSPLLDRLQRELGQLGYDSRHALAPTPVAAGLLARCRHGVQVMDRAGLREAVADLPLAALTRDPAARALVRDIGLESIGEALALPRPELGRRVGSALLVLFDRLLGLLPDPRIPWQPPCRFDQTIELQGEIAQLTALVFPARRLMLGLCGFLRGTGGGTQRLQWSLRHRECPHTCFEQGLIDPGRDPDHMLDVFRERIERLSLPAPVLALRLQVDDWQAFEERSLGLFGEGGHRDRALLERLSNRLGEQRVRSVRCRADHRPERAWRLCEPDAPGDDADSAGAQGLRYPPWLLPQPRPLERHGETPYYGGRLQLEGPPERIEAGWWDGFDITRDYFVARSPAGERLWVFRDRRGGGWYLHGLFI